MGFARWVAYKMEYTARIPSTSKHRWVLPNAPEWHGGIVQDQGAIIVANDCAKQPATGRNRDYSSRTIRTCDMFSQNNLFCP